MLSDRDYMREPEGRPPLSMTAWLMISLVVVFAAERINAVYVKAPIGDYLPLSLEGIQEGYVWQLLTFQFLHGSLLHLVGNLLGLWFCGRFVEQVIGRWRFLWFYLGTGVCGGLLHLLLAWSFPTWFGAEVVGASAGVMAVIALFCLIQPDAEFLIFFILPVKARIVLIAETAIALFFTVVPTDRGIAHAAHLGGIVAAVLFFRARWHDDMMPLPWEGLGQRLGRLFQKPAPRPVPGIPQWQKLERERRPARPVEPTPDEFMAREVDPILEKIAAHGIQSLTEREKQTLERARAKMVKR